MLHLLDRRECNNCAAAFVIQTVMLHWEYSKECNNYAAFVIQ